MVNWDPDCGGKKLNHRKYFTLTLGLYKGTDFLDFRLVKTIFRVLFFSCKNWSCNYQPPLVSIQTAFSKTIFLKNKYRSILLP